MVRVRVSTWLGVPREYQVLGHEVGVVQCLEDVRRLLQKRCRRRRSDRRRSRSGGGSSGGGSSGGGGGGGGGEAEGPAAGVSTPPAAPTEPGAFGGRSLLVGLHTCGDLACTMLRVFHSGVPDPNPSPHPHPSPCPKISPRI